MTFLLPVTINDVEFQGHAEYTSNVVGAEYKELLRPFSDLFNLGLTDTNPDPAQVLNAIQNGTYHTDMEANLEALIALARNGMTDPNDPVDPNRIHYLSIEMGASLDQLIKTLIAAGAQVDTASGSVTISQQVAVNWKNLSVNSDAVRQIVDFAISTAEDQNRTMQALVELIYVKTGNEILSDNLERLESALSTTKDSLNTLAQLQELHNKIEITEETQTFEEYASANYGAGGSDFVHGDGSFEGLAEEASEFFQALYPTVDIATISNSDTALFLDLRNDIGTQIKALSGITPGAGTNEEDGTLLANLRIVYDNMQASLLKAGGSGDTLNVKNALRLWILDGENETSTHISGLEPGEIQRKLTAAITAGQSLNDTQKEEVRRYLFVFEEYYKSAAAILTKITQILERMAQGIAR